MWAQWFRGTTSTVVVTVWNEAIYFPSMNRVWQQNRPFFGLGLSWSRFSSELVTTLDASTLALIRALQKKTTEQEFNSNLAIMVMVRWSAELINGWVLRSWVQFGNLQTFFSRTFVVNAHRKKKPANKLIWEAKINLNEQSLGRKKVAGSLSLCFCQWAYVSSLIRFKINSKPQMLFKAQVLFSATSSWKNSTRAKFLLHQSQSTSQSA